MQPLVSIITPMYNSEKFILKTIESVINQTYSNWELLLIDDGSIDNTIQIVEDFKQKYSNIKLIQNLTNLGAAMQTNHEDTEHPKHCNDEDCLMYWSAETGSGMENLIGVSTAPQLDSQCIADLQANGGK